jgi:predicted metalloprotease
VRSACGRASSAVGPFYCPTDQRVYLDLGFFDQLSRSLGAKGDFAAAYVVAHEVGHHVQNLLGVESFVNSRSASSERTRNQLSVKTELQADCFAGVWANSTAKRQLLEEGDVNEAMTAASAVGDDRIQQQTTGRINVDSFTHGSAAQRAQWFRRGFDSGDPKACDTFAS